MTPVAHRVRSDIKPSREAVQTYFQQGDLVPVYRTLLADLETPVSVYLKLTQNGQPAFLLESVEGGERIGRYSFIGVDPSGMLVVKDGVVTLTKNGQTQTYPLEPGRDPLHIIQEALGQYKAVHVPGLPRLVGGAVGYLAYDVVRYFENLPTTAQDELDVPDAAFMLPDTLVIFDHVRHQLILLANAHCVNGDTDAAYNDAVRRIDRLAAALNRPLPQAMTEAAPLREPLVSNVEQSEYEARVERAKEYIRNGDAFQIVISQRFSRRTRTDPLTLYRALRALNPSPYMFLLSFNSDLTLVGASPEVMVRFEDGTATVRPIAGTRPRGRTESEDYEYQVDLLDDPKERAEHVMLVDLGRNDLGRVCDFGTVKVTEMMVIEKYSHVMHIVSHVEGRLRQDMDAFSLIRATFPAGTLSGAPKVRAMEIIEELEGVRRGPYGGAVGYFSFDGSMDMCITIRTFLMRGDKVYVQAGAGVVADSNPAHEHQECINKAQALASAIEYAERGLI